MDADNDDMLDCEMNGYCGSKYIHTYTFVCKHDFSIFGFPNICISESSLITEIWKYKSNEITRNMEIQKY